MRPGPLIAASAAALAWLASACGSGAPVPPAAPAAVTPAADTNTTAQTPDSANINTTDQTPSTNNTANTAANTNTTDQTPDTNNTANTATNTNTPTRTPDTNNTANTAANTNTTDQTPDTNNTANTAATEPAGGPAAATAVPDFAMIDLHTGATVSLQSTVNGETPLLFWFWDPL